MRSIRAKLYREVDKNGIVSSRKYKSEGNY